MIVTGASVVQWNILAQFLQNLAGVPASSDLCMFGWMTNEKLRGVVGFNNFIGKTCQMHVAMDPEYRFSPREMLKVCFQYAFDTRKCELILGIVNGNNFPALRYDAHLGFIELLRLSGMHVGGGDLVVLGLRRVDCEYVTTIKEKAA